MNSSPSSNSNGLTAFGGETQFFFELTPERVLDAVEAAGYPCTGRCIQLNSFENRVFEIEIEGAEIGLGQVHLQGENQYLSIEDLPIARSCNPNRRVVKFYRPGRWSEAQIRQEHEFIQDLLAAEVPAVPPLEFADGGTIRRLLKSGPISGDESGIAYTIFPKVGGRAPQELDKDSLLRLGRLLGRMHAVGSMKPATERVRLHPTTYGLDALSYLIDHDFVPAEFTARYQSALKRICEIATPWFDQTTSQRLHGDCHPGNLLWNDQGPFFLDFDDMVMGPAVQDLWLLTPGRDEAGLRALDRLIEGYEEMRAFDSRSLRLVEVLRALRFVHFSAWIAKRWADPAFPQAFPAFGSGSYWQSETSDLEEQLRWVERAATGGGNFA